jgi:membrane protease YdiL (CAAX protease family)
MSLLAHLMPVIAAGLFLYIPLGIIFYLRRKPEEYGITLQRLGQSLKVGIITSILILPLFVVFYLIYQQRYLYQPFRWSVEQGWYSILLFHLLCVAFPEEVFYRGYMQSRLDQVYTKRYTLFGTQVGCGFLYTALLFALGHYLIVFQLSSLATFFPGLAFGWLRERTGGIAASTLFHALCNSTIVFLQ